MSFCRASVSRFHAWVQLDEKAGVWFLTDAESKNGTWLDKVKLTASTRTKLAAHFRHFKVQAIPPRPACKRLFWRFNP